MFEKSKNKNLLIIGAGGHGKVIADIAECMGCYETIVFADADESLKECMGYPVFREEELEDAFYEQHDVFVAVGNSLIREKITKRIQEKGCFIPTLVHPGAVIARTASIGRGTAIMAGAVINPDTKIGCSCIINTASSVDHDCKIGDYSHISVGAHLTGTVSVGVHTWIGAGACVNNNLAICDNCMIGSGAMVTEHIKNSGIYIGVPARKKNS